MGSRPARHRYCRCGTLLAKDNTERQCARCQRASRSKLISPPEVPDEFWHTEQFCEAFAAQHIGRVARAYRTHPHHHAAYGMNGISQSLLGQWLGVQQPQISRVETGPPIQHLDTLRHWAQTLRVPTTLLWFDMPDQTRQTAHNPHVRQGGEKNEVPELSFTQIIGSTNAHSGRQTGTDDGQSVLYDAMKRRTLVTWGLVSTATARLVAGSLGQVGTADVAQIQRTTARLHALDQQHGGEALWKAAATAAHEARLMLEHGTYSTHIGQQLIMATARLQVCAGWLAFDAGHHEISRMYYTDALTLARHSSDPETEIRVFALLALRGNILGQPREARRLAVTAGQIKPPAGASPRLTAIPRLRQAVASSLVAEPREADRAITAARQALEPDHDGPIEGWCAFLNSMEVDAVEATCALESGRASRAATLLERAIAGYGEGSQYARNRALYRLRLARAHLDTGAVDGAVESANVAFDDLSHELASWRVSSELDSLAGRLADYPQVQGVRPFLARYKAMSC